MSLVPVPFRVLSRRVNCRRRSVGQYLRAHLANDNSLTCIDGTLRVDPGINCILIGLLLGMKPLLDRESLGRNAHSI